MSRLPFLRHALTYARMTPAFFTLIRVLLYKAVRDCGYKAPPPITFDDWKMTPVNQLSGGTAEKWVTRYVSQNLLTVESLYSESWNDDLNVLEGIKEEEDFYPFLIENPVGELQHRWQNKTKRNASALFYAYKDLCEVVEDFAALVDLAGREPTYELLLFIRKIAETKSTVPVLSDPAVETIDRSKRSSSKIKKRRGGQKGPRKQSILRRSVIKLLNSQGIRGRQVCERLTNEYKIPLPSKKNQEIYEGDWVKWIDTNPQGFYRQWSADLKRA